MMFHRVWVGMRGTAIASAVFGVAGLAAAQDSTATATGLPGDAVDAYASGANSTQITNFVADLALKTSSWGNAYALGPVVKASKSTAGAYFDQLIAAQAISNRLTASGPILRSSYSLWNAPGQGVNATANTPPGSSVNTTGKFGSRFSLAFMEFGAGADGAFGSADDENNIIASVINFQFRRPNRLYVSRVVDATNKQFAGDTGTASFGLGAVDETGYVHIYGDNFAMQNALRLSQRNLIRLNTPARSLSFVNNIQQGFAGDAAATAFVRDVTTSMTTPNIISASLGGARPVMITTDFATNYIYEPAANTTSTSLAYLPGGVGSPRGNLAFIPQPFTRVNAAQTDVGTCATLLRTDSNTKTRAIQVFGVGLGGAVDGTTQLLLPTTSGQVIDPADLYNPVTYFGPLSGQEFTNYASQVPFRGGNSQIAMTVLPSGDLLAAALVAATGGGSTVPQGQDNYIAVARVNGTTGAITWSIAAHTGSSAGAAGGFSKAILGAGSAVIGHIARFTEVYGASSTGPSISSPAMDRAGNLYFMATVSLNASGGGQTLTTALLKANRNDVSGAFQLELIASLGDIAQGLNSTLNYQIQFMGIADLDSADSGSLWSGNIVQDSIPGVNAATVAYGGPFSLGALAFRAKIVYDVNGDGIYADPSAAGGGSNSPDQAYNVVMILMPQVKPGDFNRDGVKNVNDIFAMLAAWFQGNGDYNGDGVTNVNDIFDFLGDWFAAS